jgi:hypothetical protein
VTGPDTAKRGIFLFYDVFGLYIQALKGADILAFDSNQLPDNAGPFKVFMPDFWGDHPQDMANFPPKTPKQLEAIVAFMTGPGDPAKTMPLVEPLFEAFQKENPQIESWALLGFCWGAKLVSFLPCAGTATQ